MGEVELNTTGAVEFVVTLRIAEPSAVPPGTVLNVNVGTAKTVKLWVTDVPAYVLFAATVAVIEQLPPALVSVAIFPVTVHAVGVVELNVMGEVELVLALNVSCVPPVCVAIAEKVTVGTIKPCPCNVIDCVAPVRPKALSVKTAALIKGPVTVGLKLILKLHDPPAVSEVDVDAEQSAGRPLPATCAKFVPTLTVKDSVVLPMLETVTDLGLSTLVLP